MPNGTGVWLILRGSEDHGLDIDQCSVYSNEINFIAFQILYVLENVLSLEKKKEKNILKGETRS